MEETMQKMSIGEAMYTTWINNVDCALLSIVGKTSVEITNFPFRKWYQEGISPRVIAMRIREKLNGH
jgi:hypothetical protein